MSADHEPDAQVIVDTAMAAAEPREVNPVGPVSIVVPRGAHHETLDLERFLPEPRRATGTIRAHTVDDLARYVARHDDPESTTIWVDLHGHKVTAVINDHGVGDPNGWGDHRAVLTLAPTPEWTHWTDDDNKLMPQEQFAQHVEDGLADIVDPSGARMLEIAQSIQGTTSSQFKSARRLDNGDIAASYVQDTTARAGQKGDIEIPQRFTLGIAPFLGEDPYRVKARLRWRVRDGQLTLGYRLDRPHEVVRQAVDDIADRLSQTFAGDRVFVGAPRA